MKHVLLFCFMSCTFLLSGQMVSIEGGPVFTKTTYGEKSFVIYTATIPDKIHTGYFLRGNIQYLRSRFLELNTSLGITANGTKGTRNTQPGWGAGPIIEEVYKATISFASVNTTIRLKIPIKETHYIYLGIGPRLDYCLGYRENYALYSSYTINKLQYGLTGESGYSFNLGKMRAAVSVGFNYNKKRFFEYYQPPGPGFGSGRNEWTKITYITGGLQLIFPMNQ
jgi:hypothetical protein